MKIQYTSKNSRTCEVTQCFRHVSSCVGEEEECKSDLMLPRRDSSNKAVYTEYLDGITVVSWFFDFNKRYIFR